MNTHYRPTAAFVGASWGALIIGMAAYLIGLWNAQMQLNEKGYYLVLLLYGLFAAISLQKPCITFLISVNKSILSKANSRQVEFFFKIVNIRLLRR